MPDIKELVDIILNISAYTAKQTIRNRALFAMYYLTACRVSEITKCKQLIETRSYEIDNKKIVNTWKVKHEYLGIRKKDITFDIVREKEMMHIRTENRKNKKKTTKKQPIPISKEKDIVKFVTDYLAILKDEAILFPFTPQRAIQIINQVDFNVHFIRHIRATHLIIKYDFNEQALVQFMGWTDARPADYYVRLNTTDVAMQFFKNDKKDEG